MGCQATNKLIVAHAFPAAICCLKIKQMEVKAHFGSEFTSRSVSIQHAADVTETQALLCI